MWLVKYLKSLLSQYLGTVNMLSSLKKCTTALPPYCLITLAKMVLENVSVSGYEILGVFINTLTVDEKYSLGNRKNLPQPIQLQLSQKQNKFLEVFLEI